MFGRRDAWCYLEAQPSNVDAKEDEMDGRGQLSKIKSSFFPFSLSMGGSLQVEDVQLLPCLYMRLGRALSLEALPTPQLCARGSMEWPSSGIRLDLQCTLPIQKDWMHAPGKLEIRLADSRRKWLRVGHNGVEVDAESWRLADTAALRLQARAEVAREVPRNQGEPLLHVEIERLGVQVVL